MTTTPTFTSRIVISKEKLESWKSVATRNIHLSEDPKKWYNTPTSCHICGKYTDRPTEREAHYRDQHDGALCPEDYTGGWSYGEWACHVCGKGFDNREPRDAHYKRYHPKVTIKWPGGQPADAWHIRPHYITAERRPFRDATNDIGQSGGSGEVIDVSHMEDEDDDDDHDDDDEIIIHDGEAPPPASQNFKRHQLTEVVEIDELDSVVSGTPLAQVANTKVVGPAARVMAQLNQNGWPDFHAPLHPVQQRPLTAKSPVSAWAMEVHQEMKKPIELDKTLDIGPKAADDLDSTRPGAPAHIVASAIKQNRSALPGTQAQLTSPVKQPQSASSTTQTPPVSPQQARTPGQLASPSLGASPVRTPNGAVSARLERSAQRSTLHGRIQRSLYNAGLQFNKISEDMTMTGARDQGDGSSSDSLKSAPGIEPLQSRELNINILRPLFDAADLQMMNEELASVVVKINTAVKSLQSDHQFLTTRERMFALKKEALNKKAAGLRDEHSKKIAVVEAKERVAEAKERELQDRIKEIEDSFNERLQDAIKRNEELYAERVALLDVRENDLEDRETDVEIRENACKDKVDEMTDPMESDEGFEDAVEQMMEG